MSTEEEDQNFVEINMMTSEGDDESRAENAILVEKEEYDEDYLENRSLTEIFKIHYKNWMIFPQINPQTKENNWIYENEEGDPVETKEKFWSFSVLRAGLLGVFLLGLR